MKTKNLEWTFRGFNRKLDKLEPLIRERAVEIAGELMDTGEFTQERAVEAGIELTEELHYDLEE
ncbi:MAG: hypothetical protein WA913_08160 [Pricia sp.]